jgi:hypothetical protein
MVKRKIIASFLSLLLFIFFNNNLPFELRPFHNNGYFTQSLSSLKSAKSLSESDLSVSKPIVKQVHIKVRYMGSQCGFHVAPFHIAFKTRAFVNPKVSIIRSCSFISSCDRFLFKLRGPPPLLATPNLFDAANINYMIPAA